jgi:prepilin-type N-terminal cleavage/methylation domain-containing protein
MKMNDKGFTLVELLAVLAIIAIIGMIAIPNVISVMDNNKKDLMIQDAQKMISLAKAEIVKDREFRDDPSKTEKSYPLSVIDKKGVVETDPDGGKYDRDKSYVKYIKSQGYCVYLLGSKREIKKSKDSGAACIDEEKLTSRSYVFDR